jgi:hypothetical protein
MGSEVEAASIWTFWNPCWNPCHASVPFPRRDFFREPPLPGVQSGIVFAVPRLEPARADFRGVHGPLSCIEG